VATLTDQVWDVRSTVQPLRVGLWAPLRAPFGAVFAAWAGEERVHDWLAEVPREQRGRQLDALRAIHDRGFVVELRTPSQGLVDGTGSLAGMFPAESGADEEFLLTLVEPARRYAVSTIEAPVLDADGEVALALVLVGLPRSMRGSEITAVADRLLLATGAVSSALGADPNER
jgi:hypothetical protein